MIVTGSILFKPLRDRLKPVPLIGKLVECPMCFGWWVGLAASFTELRLTTYHLADAFAASAACWILHVVLAKLGAEEL